MAYKQKTTKWNVSSKMATHHLTGGDIRYLKKHGELMISSKDKLIFMTDKQANKQARDAGRHIYKSKRRKVRQQGDINHDGYDSGIKLNP